MAATSIRLDTTGATEKLKELQAEADKVKEAMFMLKNAACEAKEAMRSFVKACGGIDLH
jgi:hypothetical protein